MRAAVAEELRRVKNYARGFAAGLESMGRELGLGLGGKSVGVSDSGLQKVK